MNSDKRKFICTVAITGIIFDILCIASYFISGRFCENTLLAVQGRGGIVDVEFQIYFISLTTLIPPGFLSICGLIIILLIMSYSGLDGKFIAHIRTIAVIKVLVLAAIICYTGIYVVAPAATTQQGINPLTAIQNVSLIIQPIVMVASYAAFVAVFMNDKKRKFASEQMYNNSRGSSLC